MKIIFLITKLDYSGGPKMLAWVANQFAKRGYEVGMLSIYSDMIGQPLEPNIKFHALNYSVSSNRLIRNSVEMIKVVRGIDKYIKKENPDLVVSFLYAVDLFYLLKAKISRQKMLISMRLDPYSEKGLSAKIKHWLTKKADGLVFQTEGAKEFYGKKVLGKSVVIPNPVTSKTLIYENKVKSFLDRKDVIVLPARLNIYQKRQDVMIKAFEIVHNRYPEYRLVLLGDGPDKDYLKELANSCGISEYVEFHKSVKSAEEFTYDCKIVTLTSDFEGIPNTLIEALSMGLNVVATDCSPGGAKMLIDNGVNGFLVDRGDYNNLAEKICYYIENPEEADKMGKNAKKLKELYSEEKIAQQWIDFVEKIV